MQFKGLHDVEGKLKIFVRRELIYYLANKLGLNLENLNNKISIVSAFFA